MAAGTTHRLRWVAWAVAISIAVAGACTNGRAGSAAANDSPVSGQIGDPRPLGPGETGTSGQATKVFAIGCWQHADVTVGATTFVGAWSHGATTGDCRFRVDAPPGTTVLRVTLAVTGTGLATFSGTFGLADGQIDSGGGAFGVSVHSGAAVEVTVGLGRSRTVLIAAHPTADATAVIAASSAA